jgi:hypothetical protein
VAAALDLAAPVPAAAALLQVSAAERRLGGGVHRRSGMFQSLWRVGVQCKTQWRDHCCYVRRLRLPKSRLCGHPRGSCGPNRVGWLPVLCAPLLWWYLGNYRSATGLFRPRPHVTFLLETRRGCLDYAWGCLSRAIHSQSIVACLPTCHLGLPMLCDQNVGTLEVL